MTRAAQLRAPRGYFGVAIYHPKTESNVGSLLRSAHLFGAAFLATVGRRYRHQASDTSLAIQRLPTHHYPDLDDLLNHLPIGCPLVGVELDPRAQPLPSFTHPPRALYLLGAEDNGLPPAVVDRCHAVVEIPTVKQWPMNVACAGSIVLAHRHMAGHHG